METEDIPRSSAFLLLKYHDGTSFGGVNPFKVAEELDSITDGVASAKAIRSGALLVRTYNSAQTAALLGIQSFLGKEVDTQLATHLNTTDAVAYVPTLLDVEDEQIVRELASQGVIGVQRLKPKNGRRNALIRFRFHGLSHPETINIGYDTHQLRLWIRSPAMCRRCARFGHTTSSCKSTHLRCLQCSGDHATDNCTADTYRLCPHCSGPHAAWDRTCPALLEQLQRAEEVQQASAREDQRSRRQLPPESAPGRRTRIQTARRPPGPTLPESTSTSTQTERLDSSAKKNPHADNTTQTVKTKTRNVATEAWPKVKEAATQVFKVTASTVDRSSQTSLETTPALEGGAAAVSSDTQTDLSTFHTATAGTQTIPQGAIPYVTSSRATPSGPSSPGPDWYSGGPSPLQTRLQRRQREEAGRTAGPPPWPTPAEAHSKGWTHYETINADRCYLWQETGDCYIYEKSTKTLTPAPSRDRR